MRDGEPLLHVADVDLPCRPRVTCPHTGLWADHHCEAPFEQWTVRNECHAVTLDDPTDALGRAYGTAAAVAFDVEWYAAGRPAALDGGYVQAGEAHAVIEVAGGPIEVVGPAARSHTWGPFAVLPGAGTTGAADATGRHDAYLRGPVSPCTGCWAPPAGTPPPTGRLTSLRDASPQRLTSLRDASPDVTP